MEIQKTPHTKKVHGREIPMFIYDRITKPIRKFGTSAHSYISINHVGREAHIVILGLEPFICSGCYETITLEENYSPQEKLCMSCFSGKDAISNDKCISKPKGVSDI